MDVVKLVFAVAGSAVLAVPTVLTGQASVPSATSATSQENPELAAARAAWERHPTNADSIIWYGRRVGYTGDFARAVAIYTEGLKHHPDEPRLLRHRGHRYISMRDFPRAIADLSRAREIVAGTPDQVEPDGQPNARGIPTSTLHGNIRYHLALAHYVTGDFEQALPVWAEDARLARNHDHQVAATYWWVLTLAQLGRHDEARAALAPIQADWDIIENGSYHQLLLWMKGELAESALLPAGASPLELQTIGNGIGQWHAANGRPAEAEAAFRRVLATGPSASFGYIAAEAGLARLR
ncbi:MAG TPA: tetratricopeptide repeat protein [Gemmatimonadaceae bacterium]|nr:tetratricopeptide repeat protein [Gemmatimonadaceae bacterium]